MRATVLVCGTVLAALASTSTHCQGAFHLWTVQEVYSSGDGSLQYIELHDNFNFENFIGGHNVIASGGGPNRTFSFLSNLPTTATANKTLLLATANFQSLTGVTPDFTIAGGFLNLGGGTVTFDGSGSSITYAAGAFAGNRSVGPGGIAQLPSPTNFAGQTATIVPEPAAAALGAAAFVSLIGFVRRRR